MKKIVLLVLMICSYFATFPQELDFIREDVNFKIIDSNFYVEGIYFYKNELDKEVNKNIINPFPIDPMYGFVDSIKVLNLKNNKLDNIVDESQKGILFRVKAEPKEVVKYKISYRHKLNNGKAEYILISMLAWGKPLKQANFKLIVPENLKINSLSYKPDSSVIKNNKKYYYWHKENFVPDRNFVVFFEYED